MSRERYVFYLKKVAEPVLVAAAEGKLKEKMKVEDLESVSIQDMGGFKRTAFTYFEAVSRLVAGITPWFEVHLADAAEQELQSRYLELTVRAIDAQTNESSADYGNFEQLNHHHSQTLVDTAFLAQALVRSRVLRESLGERITGQVLRVFELSRKIKPNFSNWLLFSAMVEAGIEVLQKGSGDIVRVEYGYRQMEQWYMGDGFYSDGPAFAMDYYNSFIIQPMLLDIFTVFEQEFEAAWIENVKSRAKRHGEFLERMICPDGTFIAIGRSITYRCGAFQLLAQLALKHMLPNTLSKAQVRCGLLAVMEKTLSEQSFREDGYLALGLCGKQPGLAELYISTGSLYLCSGVFLVLGLPEEDEFFTGLDEAWTQKKIWAGEDQPADHKLH